jgi:vesicle coat complex subunit
MKPATPNKEKPCYLYIQQNEQNMPNSQDLQKQLETGKIEEKIKALKTLIISIIHDESFPRMLMTIFNLLVPIQNESHALKKILLYYWEVTY